MSKKKGPDVPQAPQEYSDPNYPWSQDTLKSEADKLIQLKGLPDLLNEAIQFNPELQKYAIQQYTSAQEPAYRKGLQDITNTLEANNQLTGSTTGNALQNYENDYLAGLTSANAGMAINQINNALSNRIGLYTTGLNTAQAVGKAGLENQSQKNQFALQNYENQVASALMNQPQQNSGFWSTLGGLAGAGLGTLIPGVGNLAGAMIGGGLGSGLGAGFSGGDPTAGLMAAGNAFGWNKYAGANPNVITSNGAGAKSESIVNSLGSYNAMGGGSAYMNKWGF